MVGRDQIRRWAREGLISPDQAEKLLATLPALELESAAASLGSPVVTGVMLAAAALNGAVIFVFSALHGVDAAAHTLVLLWLLSVAPLAYMLRHASFTILVCVLFFAWVGLFVHGNVPVLDALGRLVFLPVTYLAAGVAMFAVGGTHHAHPALRSIARTYRLAGLQVALLSLFALGFETFGGRATEMSDWRRVEASNRFLLGLLSLCAVGAAFTLINWRLARRIEALTRAEVPVSLAMIGLVVVYALVPLPSVVCLILWNAVLIAMLAVALRTGWRRGDRKLVDLGGAGLLVVLLARYVDLSWERLPFGTLLGALTVLVVVGVSGFLIIRAQVVRPVEEKKAEESAVAPLSPPPVPDAGLPAAPAPPDVD